MDIQESDSVYHKTNDKYHLKLEEEKKRIKKNNKIEKDLINASKRLEKIEERKNIIRSIQNIDYSKSGWGLKLSKILGISSQRTVKFVQYHMLDELNPKFNNI